MGITPCKWLRCHAKTRSGGRCKNRAMENGRCRMHGGKTPKGQMNNLRHGVYAEALTESEKEAWERIPIGSIDDEIRLAKLQLKRAFKAQMDAVGIKQERVEKLLGRIEKEPSDLRVSEIRAELDDNGQINRSATKRRPDYWILIDRLLGRVGKLESTRAGLKLKEIESLLNELREMVEDVRVSVPAGGRR